MFTFNIAQNGDISGLYNDLLTGIAGNKTIERFSNVEFNSDIQKWVITIEQGKYKGCSLVKTFSERNKAIEHEIDFFNNKGE